MAQSTSGVSLKDRTLDWYEKWQPSSLRARFAIIFGLAVTPPAILIFIAAYANFVDDFEAIENRLAAVAEAVSENHQNLIASVEAVLSALASQDVVRMATHPDCSEVLQAVRNSFDYYSGLRILDREGKVACSDLSDQEGTGVSERHWFQRSIAGEGFVLSDFLTNRLTEEQTIVAATPLEDPSAKITGVLAASLNLSSVILLTRFSQLPEDAFALLVDSHGKAIDLAPPVAERMPDLPVLELLMNTESGKNGLVQATAADGSDYVLAIAPLLDGQLHVFFGRPAANVWGWSWVKLVTSIGSPLLVWLIAVITAWIATDYLVIRWIVTLERFAMAYAAGRYTVRPKNLRTAPRELKALGDSLGHMMDKISARDLELKEAVVQRESLIKETHHRVKNNLQIISSLLHLQARHMQGSEGRDTILNMQNRINALALVHRSLYETHDLEQVNLKAFFEMLGDQLNSIIEDEYYRIDVEIDAPALYVQADTAITLAMLITEASLNAFKHAFPSRSTGKISVNLVPTREGGAVLTIADNGIGISVGKALAEESVSGIGTSLIEGFARQLSATLSISEEGGTIIQLEIPHLK